MGKRSARSEACEKLFADDEKGYKCLVDNCGAVVCCIAKKGCPGRLSHLASTHCAVFKGLPAAKQIARNKGDKTASCQATPDGPESASQASASQLKKVTKDKRIREDVVDLFARNLLPFSLAEDPFFEGLSRKTIRTQMQARHIAVRDSYWAACVGDVAVSIDSGTNGGSRTTNVVAVHKAIQTTIAARRAETMTSDAIVEMVIEALAPLKHMRIAAFTSDNASNMRKACETLALMYKGLNFSCVCHAINTVVRRIAYTWKVVDDARTIVAKVRISDKRIPQEIDSRWCACFESIEATVKLGPMLTFEDHISKENLGRVLLAKEALAPFYYSTRECESNKATIFESINALSKCLKPASDDSLFVEIFQRNIYHESLVAACALSPTLCPEALCFPTKLMIEECIDTCATAVLQVPGVRVQKEVSLLLDGGFQSIYRKKELKESVRSFWNSGDTPMLASLALILVASSASVERSFSAHARCHSWLRSALNEDSVEMQLGLHSLLASMKEKNEPIDPASPSWDAVEAVLGWCTQVWCRNRSSLLKPDERITAWFVNNGRQLPYRGVLIGDEGGSWKVKWSGCGDRSAQRLHPSVDPWVFCSEIF